jgi:hypothetical protein
VVGSSAVCAYGSEWQSRCCFDSENMSDNILGPSHVAPCRMSPVKGSCTSRWSPDADRLIIRYPSRWAALPCDDAPTTRPAQLPNGGACPAAKRACRLRSSAEGHTCAIPRIRPLRSDHRVHAPLPEGGGPEELTGRDGMHEVVILQRGERAQAEVSYPPIELDLIRECSEFRLFHRRVGRWRIRRAGSDLVAVPWHTLVAANPRRANSAGLSRRTGPAHVTSCGRRSAGTITWMTGPKTLAEYVAPTPRGAAEAAHRPQRVVRVVAPLPVCVTDDVNSARVCGICVSRATWTHPAVPAHSTGEVVEFVHIRLPSGSTDWAGRTPGNHA